MNIAIIFAGGIGQRMNNEDNIPKQFLNINSKPIIIHTLELFQRNENIDKIYIAIHPNYVSKIQNLVEHYYITKTQGIVKGGATGQDSIFNALSLAYQENDKDSIVLIHDGVRPFVTQETINNNIESAKKYRSAITCTSCTETILISKDGISPSTVPFRKETFAAQAPQTFILDDIYNAHLSERRVNPEYKDIIDSCTLFEKQGKTVHMVSGNRGNIKITTMEDLYILRALIRFEEDMEMIRANKEELVCRA